MEKTLLKLLMRREAWDKHSSLIDLKELKEAHRELSFLYNVVYELHETVDTHDITCDELELVFWAKFPDASKELYTGLLQDIRQLDVSEAVGASVLSGMARKRALISLSEASYELSQGRGTPEAFKQLYEAVSQPAEADIEFTAVSTDLEELVASAVLARGLRWRLDCLNKSLGSLRKGDFGFVFARPETGKTSFLASELSAMIDDAPAPLLWFNLEEQGEKVMLRFFQAYFGVKLDVLLANVKQYKKLFNERVGKKLVLVDDASLDRSRIERIIHSVQPALIVVDQLDKVKGFKADRDDLVYGAIYQWAREFAKVYAPTIGICQADGTAEGQKWLSMANVSNAKTSKQAEADFILGIGKSHDEAGEHVRYLNISKNKLIGDADTMPSLRHGRMEVLLKAEVARYQDIVRYE